MKVIGTALLGAIVLFGSAGPARPQQQSFPEHVFVTSQVRALPVTAEGRHYQLYIGLPDSYGKDPSRRYPVVYVTDAYWDFAKIKLIGGALVYDRVAPEFITVGLGYAGANLNYGDLRRWELAPAPFGDQGENSGHAADFLRELKTKIVPLVDAEYRTDPSYRVLAGSSLGGTFALYTMLSDPGLFQAYIAATPDVTLGKDWLFRYEEKLAASGAGLKGRLFMTVGGNEQPAYLSGIIRFNQRLASRRYPGFDYQFRIVEGGRHTGGIFEAYTRGLGHALLPLAPESGPAPGP